MAWGSSSCWLTAEETECRCSSALLLPLQRVQREARLNTQRPTLPLPPHDFHTYGSRSMKDKPGLLFRWLIAESHIINHCLIPLRDKFKKSGPSTFFFPPPCPSVPESKSAPQKGAMRAYAFFCTVIWTLIDLLIKILNKL